MRTILVLAAAFGFTVSAASADCAGHTASVDKEMTTASVSKDQTPIPTPVPADSQSVKQELPQQEAE
ncbi:hypothetical protein CU102_13555 [Phyllobacterium brassicacearum]|uniref:Secreted protein n=1 Tax=Phyllobacterium brassicacearum TaxID=314235 RepID=A0A2P7BPC7_9HYPH|nr:hypothetical protein [Phyllobacterium brassicacearum]PSH68323.1 hypothetical protein CU102_13555 [Phyllobacterium brassicacearum]TDQ31820.1 hypothetical protein DEV91_107159 [Phyllobacterium brassicacearum]